MTGVIGNIFLFGLLMSTIVTIVCQEDWDQRCGTKCVCKWISGKKAAECKSKSLSSVPIDLSSEIQMLDLRGNRIPYLSHLVFSVSNLLNLHKLVLRDCSIESIDSGALSGLKIVTEIDLSMNSLRKIVAGTFSETQRLSILRLNDNSLESLENGVFQNLLYLQKIILSNNRLSWIGERAFRNLPGLQILALGNNNLSTIKKTTVESLPRLSSLELNNNPWNCDCHLREFRDWTLERKLYTKPTSCRYPDNLAGKMWDDTSSDSFDCRPRIHVSPNFRVEEPGQDIQIWCKTTGTQRPQLSWIHGGKIISNLSKRESSDSRYVLNESVEWLNLTIPGVMIQDEGAYTCLAKGPQGSAEKTVGLTIVINDPEETIQSMWPFSLGLGSTFLLLLLIFLMVIAWYQKKGSSKEPMEKPEGSSLCSHGLEESVGTITATPNTGTARVLMAEITSGNNGEEHSIWVGEPGVWTALGPSHVGLTRSSSCREARGLPSRRAASSPLGPNGPQFLTGSTHPIVFRTLPRKRTTPTPSSPRQNGDLAMMIRQGYVTLPRRPRPPSWGAGTNSAYGAEPIYDNLGARTTADGSSVLSLNNPPELGSGFSRGRTSYNRKPSYAGIERGHQAFIDRLAPEGASEWTTRLAYENDQLVLYGEHGTPEKHPPKPTPKQRFSRFQDEDDDGTEV